jgi:hypothetical protein
MLLVEMDAEVLGHECTEADGRLAEELRRELGVEEPAHPDPVVAREEPRS